jgi:hypothetical protein
MKSFTKFVLLAVSALTTLTLTAAAQNQIPRETTTQPQTFNAVYIPAQNAASLTQVDWDDHRRCDGDHDRDDRNCYRRDRDDRYYRGNGYVGNGYYYGTGRNNYYSYGSNGWYDNKGRWHVANGWYDNHGKWHKGNDRDRD